MYVCGFLLNAVRACAREKTAVCEPRARGGRDSGSLRAVMISEMRRSKYGVGGEVHERATVRQLTTYSMSYPHHSEYVNVRMKMSNMVARQGRDSGSLGAVSELCGMQSLPSLTDFRPNLDKRGRIMGRRCAARYNGVWSTRHSVLLVGGMSSSVSEVLLICCL